MGTPSIEELIPFIIMGVFAAVDILLLKLALVLTKAQKRTRMKWVAGSFAIQFGIIFIISSPLFLLDFMGAFNGGGPKLDVLIPIVILSAFINLNVINVLHQVGLKSSSVILLLVFVPLYLIMFGLSQIL
jgi:cation transport ATPase